MKNLKNYQTRDRESGNVIDEFCSIKEAEKALQFYEEADKRDGYYTGDYYEIYDKQKQNIIN